MKRILIAELLADQKLLTEFYADMNDGAVAVIPTDTLYGFAVASRCSNAVAKIYKIKNRDAQKPLILFLEKVEWLKKLQFDVSSAINAFLLQAWPGALTAVLPRPLIAGLDAFTFPTIGVRIPDHQQLLALLASYSGFFLTTSANRSGNPSDNDPQKIADEFAEEVDWLIDGGILQQTLPSTVVDFSVSPPRVLRHGAVAFAWHDTEK